MSGASMMQGSGRPQVSDEPRRGNFGAPVKLSENMKTPETARISPKISPNQPEIARYVSSPFVWAQHSGILFPSKIREDAAGARGWSGFRFLFFIGGFIFIF